MRRLESWKTKRRDRQNKGRWWSQVRIVSGQRHGSWRMVGKGLVGFQAIIYGEKSLFQIWIRWKRLVAAWGGVGRTSLFLFGTGRRLATSLESLASRGAILPHHKYVAPQIKIKFHFPSLYPSLIVTIHPMAVSLFVCQWKMQGNGTALP